MQMQNFEKHVWAEIDLDALRANFRTVKQRQAAFAKFAKLVQAVLDADPTTLPRRDIGLAPRGWLDCQALVLPYSTSWEKARREAVAVMGYTDRVQL